MKYNTKFIENLLIGIGFLSLSATITLAQTEQEKYQTSFPGVNNEQLYAQIQRDGESQIVPTNDTYYVGANVNKSSSFHHEMYTSIVPGDHVLEIGCGKGYTSYRLQLLGANVDAIELSPDALLETTALAEQYGNIEITGTYAKSPITFRQGNILQDDCVLEDTKYDKALLHNVLHYMSPEQAIKTLIKIKSSLKDEHSRIYITMDACCAAPEPLFDFYKEQTRGNIDFSGHVQFEFKLYISEDQKDILGGDFTRISHLLTHCEKQHITTEASPLTQDGTCFIQTQTQSFFYGDTESLRLMTGAAGLEIVDAYYLQDDDTRIDVIGDLYEFIPTKMHATVKLRTAAA